MDKTLPPINHKDDIDSFQAFTEQKEVSFKQHNHKNVYFDDLRHELRCTCGAAWTGERLHELERLLTKINEVQ